MTTAFQPGAFQSDGFQIEGGVAGAAITINIGGVQEGDSGNLTIALASQDVTGGWPIYYPRRKRPTKADVPLETPEEVTARLVAVQQALAVRKELRRAERRSEEITAQLREIYAEQDALALSAERLEIVIQQQMQDDEDLALVLALAG